MTLIDTSIWIDHLRKPEELVSHLLRNDEVTMHPYVIGEVALGNLSRRSEIVLMLSTIPTTEVAKHDDVMRLIDQHRLFGTGLGYVDVHLLTSARLMRETTLWTRDKQLHAAADRLGVALRLN